ncbi:TetR/AcrR family transcriptional regulator [Streptomyces scabiei]|uniref:TetR/AcrR family transcriptional regulator n=1 Tax=Streptomyces scabiei TaxID=1930 RepID=UPI002D21E9B3|nr:TetR/AcrR family transcriptional regulator [Streptomyces scabiei]
MAAGHDRPLTPMYRALVFRRNRDWRPFWQSYIDIGSAIPANRRSRSEDAMIAARGRRWPARRRTTERHHHWTVDPKGGVVGESPRLAWPPCHLVNRQDPLAELSEQPSTVPTRGATRNACSKSRGARSPRSARDASREAIAKDAGVGIGTLYRHFPTREALLEAAYRNELARVCDSATELLAQLPPDQAMRQWMDLFIDYLAVKQGMADELKAVIASADEDPFAEGLERISTAISTLLHAGAEVGVLRSDVDPLDVGFSLGGVLLITSDKGLRDRAGRMLDLLLDLLLDGLRYRSG